MHNAIGAHIYAGGFTVGVKKHFNVLAHLEHAAYGEEVIRLNYPDLPVYAGGPEAWKPFLDSLPRGKDRPRFIFANPPCAIWSGASAGRVTEWHEDPRLAFHHDIFDLLGSVEPDVMAIESVPPIFTKGRAHVDDLITKAKTLGYSTTVVKHNAMWMGVAQKRGRIFLAFHRVDIDWALPNFEKAVTVRQALRGVPNRTKGYDTTIRSEKLLHLLEHTPPGGRVRAVFDSLGLGVETGERGQIIGRPSFLETRFPLDKVGPIVLAGKSIHPTEPRYMNQEELAAICSFPPNYKWPARSYGDISGFMSRGVMPRVGEWLAENVARAIDAGKRSNEQTATVYDVTGPPGREYELPSVSPSTYYDMKSSSGEAEQLDLPWGKVPAAPKPAAPVRVRPKVLLTGSTAMQVGSDRTQLKILTSMRCWCEALKDLNYDVEWRPVVPGEDLKHYEVVIASLNAPNKTVSRYFYGALWALLKRPDAIIAVDDWQVGELISGIRTCARDRKTAFWVTQQGGEADAATKAHEDRLFIGLDELTEWWRWPVIVPILGDGDVGLLKIPTRMVVSIDPTSYALRYPHVDVKRKKRWVQASLLHKSSPDGLTWPVELYGWQNRLPGGVGARGENAQPRITEPELMAIYGASFGVLSPAHPHAGSGWWRVRYLMAADAGAVLSADPREAACLGDPYTTASDPRRVEKLSLAGLADLAASQAARLAEITWSKDRVKKALKNLIASRASLAPIPGPQTAPVVPIGAPKKPVPAPAAVPDRPKAVQTPMPPRKPGSGARIREMLLAGRGTPDILATIHSEFPGSKATTADVSWNKQKLRNDARAAGLPPPL